MRFAFLIAYDGSRYSGFARQPSKLTVEAELLRAFKLCGLYRDLTDARFRVAARTDRGVSAVGQVVALNVLGKPNLNIINTHLPEDIGALAATEVQPDFDPRAHALEKHYRYVCEAPSGFDSHLARQAARLLEGTHDFKHFCKHEEGRPTIAELKRVSIRGRKTLTFDFIARAFLWQQVRRMVGALLSVGTGKLSLDRLEGMLTGQGDQAIRPAPPEGLFLVGVRYPSLVLKLDKSAASRFAKYLVGRRHPCYRSMIGLLFQKQ